MLSSSHPRSERVLVLGAGPAGLSAGVLLHRRGLEVTVVEKARHVGGLTRTMVHDGFRFDLGGHRFYTKKQEVFDFVSGLLGDDFLEVPRLSRIHFRGRFVDYPIRPLNALRNVGPATCLGILRDLAQLSVARNAAAPESLQDWMVSAYGKTLFETYFKVYAEKVWGIPADKIHADLAAQRVKGLGLRETLGNALFPRSRRAIESKVERFHYPRLGYGQICDGMEAELSPHGGVALETRPRRVLHDGARIVGVELQDRDGDVRVARPEHVISSIPLPALVRMFDPAPPADVQRAADGLGFRAVVFVAVFIDRAKVRPESWIYFPSPEISFGRITEPNNWSAAMSPPGKTSIVAEHFCTVGDATWSASDEELARTTVDDLSGKLGFFRPDEVLGTCVVRVPRAYPRMDVDHKRGVVVLEQYLDRFANLQAIGRNGMFRYHNTDHVIETAFAAAANVLGDAQDVRAINSELVYHEEKLTG